MKKLIAVLLCLVIALFTLYVPAMAKEPVVSLAPESDNAPIESAAKFFVSLDDAAGITADSLSVVVSHSSIYFSFAEASFSVTDNADSNTSSGNTHTITYKSPTELRGKVFEFSLIGLQTNTIPRTVSVTVIARKNGSIVLSESVETKIHLVCKDHLFELWNTTSEADCENAGSRERSCSICNYTETEEIAALGHDFKDMTVLRPATCLDIGYERGFCTRCQRKLLREIPALGHDMSEFVVTAPPTCTGKGLDTSSCSRCTATETRETEALGHEFTEAVVTTEPTIGKYGVKTGYCTRCSETTTADVECAYNDETAGVRLDTTLGVFPESTKASVSVLKEGGSDYGFIERSIAHITNRFTGYVIKTTNHGVAVHPEGEVTVTFTVPEGYGKKANFYYINDEGDVKKLSPTWNEDFTKATVKLVDTGFYAISKSGFDAATSTKTLLEKLTLSDVIIVASIVLILCWLFIALRIIKVKNQKLYRKITHFLPTRSEIKNASKRYWFVFSTTVLFPAFNHFKAFIKRILRALKPRLKSLIENLKKEK